MPTFPSPTPGAAAPSRPALLPLGALAAGFGLAFSPAMAQQAPPPVMAASAAAPAGAASAPAMTTLPQIKVKAAAEPSGKTGYQATTTRIGKGKQDLRDVPQSVTVVTERLIDDRNVDTMKEALKNTAGISFQAAEGGEEDIRLRGFSLQSTGDIFIDGMRDPAFYERDSFNWDRLELLRGSASMLFGRGSTGGAVNQVTKQPQLSNDYEVSTTLGTGDYLRTTMDFNQRTGETAAVRLNAMLTVADNYGNKIDNKGIAPTVRWGIGTADEFSLGLYHLENNAGIHYGLPWLTPGPQNGGDFLWTTDPKNYYGLASDYLRGGTTQGNGVHTHRFDDGGELRTALRVARYTRDQRASAVRFAPGTSQPGLVAVTSDTFSDATVLNRSNGTGVQAKIMNMDTQYLQSDYSGKFKWGGLSHGVQAGADLAHEEFENFGIAPTSPLLAKPPTTVGTPNDGASVNEGARATNLTRTFDMKALGIYAQDLVQIAPAWKVLAGLRLDKLDGSYHAVTAQGQATVAHPDGPPNPPLPNPCYTPAGTQNSRNDTLWSKRFGVLYQPSPTQSYHFSYGTSFNTSGDTYQFDPGTVNTAPESSRNIELGAKIDNARGDLSTRFAVFHATKYNERNRDAESVNQTSCNYVLSGERHAAGIEFDITGRISPEWEVFGSYAFIPSAKVDSSTGGIGTERVGSRPGLTPRHSGTIWTTYKVTPRWRLGGGLNARSGDRPVGLAASSPVYAPRFITGDLMAEFDAGPAVFKLNVTNVTNEHYADMIYRGHYVPGKPRTVQVTSTLKF